MGAPGIVRIGLASVCQAPSVEERLATLENVLDEARGGEVSIVCFPETYIPGLRGQETTIPPHDQRLQEEVLERIRVAARTNGVAVVVGMEWESRVGIHNVAFVISRAGDNLGYQPKNQIPLEEEPYYVPQGGRRLFEVDGLTFGVTICHEGWRYPEATRWAAARGAHVVFHPQQTGGDREGATPAFWGDPKAPYYEKAMIARAVENTIYFGSVNYAMQRQESATSLIDPDGACVAYVPYGEERLLVHDIDLARATGFCARRFKPEFYPA
jgi:predicted amidohydrolase